MESITSFPTFTIPTHRCCSLILPFADIADILGNRAHIIQIGIGEFEKNFYQIEKLGIDWLHAPAGWPIMASGFNPGNNSPDQHVFQYDLNLKKIQISNGPSRVCLGYDEIVRMVEKSKNPRIDILCLPCEEDTVEVTEPEMKKPKTSDAPMKSKEVLKLKRRANRRHQSFVDAVTAAGEGKSFAFVCPLTSFDQQLHAVLNDSGIAVNGYSGQTNLHKISNSASSRRFVQIHNNGKNLEEIFSEIKSVLSSKSGDVVETDFPFRLAREGILMNENFELVNMKEKCMFNDHSELLNFPNSSEIPPSVIEAAAHMKSYIHHLFRCDELSGPILLATVNLFQFDRLFSKYRD